MAGLQAVGDHVDVQGLLLLDGGSDRLCIRVLDVRVPDPVDEVVDDLLFDVQLLFQAVSEEIDWHEAVVTRIQLLELLIHFANDLQLIELLGVLEERRRQAEERRVEHFVDRFVLKARFDEPDEFLGQVLVRNDVFNRLDEVIAVCIAFAGGI